MYALIGLIFGAIFSIIAVLGGTALSSGNATSLFWNIGFVGVFAVVVFPVLYGVLGFIFAVITAGVFNLVVRLVGPLQIEIED